MIEDGDIVCFEMHGEEFLAKVVGVDDGKVYIDTEINSDEFSLLTWMDIDNCVKIELTDEEIFRRKLAGKNIETGMHGFLDYVKDKDDNG